MAVSAPTRKIFGSFSMFASKPFEDAGRSGGSMPSTRLSVSSKASFLSRISGTHQSSTDEEKPKERRKSGQMLALSFDDDAKMQSYLTRSSSFPVRDSKVSQEEEICV